MSRYRKTTGELLEQVRMFEGKMKDIYTMAFAGDSAEKIAKELNLDVKTVKQVLGEEIAMEKVERVPTGQYIVTYKDSNGKGMARVFDYRQHAHDFEKEMKKKGMSEEELKDNTLKLKEDKGDKDSEIESLKKEIAMLKQKAETEKAKTHKSETEKLVNPDTGEPILQVGVAYKHLKDKEAKEKAAEVRLKRKDKEDKEKAVQKFKDRIKESANLNESEASDQAKNLGLDYMQFGRYGKNGKVTHMSKGGQLVKVSGDKDVDTKSSDGGKSQGGNDGDDNTKSEPKPVVDKFDAQKDLEDMVTDGMIDVDDDGEGGLTATKEYEPSQDYEAEKDVENITQYFKDKGVDEKDIYVDVDSEEDYISVSVEVRGKGKVKTEEIELDEMTFNKAMVDKLKKAYEPLRGKRIAPEPLMKIFDKIDSNKDALITLYKADIPFVSTLAGSRLSQKHNLSPMDIKRIISKEEVQEEVELTEYFATVHSDKKQIADFIKKNKKGIDYVDDDAGGNIEFEGKNAHELADKVKAKFGVRVTKESFEPLEDKSLSLDENTTRYMPSMNKSMTVQYTYTRNPDLFSKTLSGTKTGKTLKNVGPKLKGVYVLQGKGQDHIEFLKTLNQKGIMPINKILGEELEEDTNKYIAEKIKGLENKAKKTGMPYGILKKVYDRGMAAWKGGHRPGASQQQWAFARVNSFVTKSSGTWGGADSDLAKKVRASEEVEESRQLKDKEKEMMVVKDGKVKVIDKSDWEKYKAKGYNMAESVQEADLTDKQVDMVKKVADKLPKDDFKKRYGKDAENVKFGTATNIVKKKLNIDEYEGARNLVNKLLNKEKD